MTWQYWLAIYWAVGVFVISRERLREEDLTIGVWFSVALGQWVFWPLITLTDLYYYLVLSRRLAHFFNYVIIRKRK